jgi:hypothetical protein
MPTMSSREKVASPNAGLLSRTSSVEPSSILPITESPEARSIRKLSSGG